MEGNNLFHDRYFLERLLGRGNFSEVWLAKDTKTDVEVALKVYAPATGLDDMGLNVLAREFSIVVNANHKNLLKPLYYDTFERKPYLVLPYCRRGSVTKSIGKMSEDDAWRMLRDVASGLTFLHALNPPIIHQDIKPDNIMIDDNNNFVITDFGVSTHVRSTLRKSLSLAFASAGTIAYMAPERFGEKNTPIMANDIYSLAVTVYEMLTGEMPFGEEGGLLQKKGAAIPQLPEKFSPELRKVITKCLNEQPWKRPTAEQLEQYAIQHIEGKKIHFVDEKTFMQRFGVAIVAIVAIVIGGGIFAGISMNNAAKEKARIAEKQRIAAFNDSVNTLAQKYLAHADSLISVGDTKYEMYEVSYIDALKSIQTAQSLASQATPVTITIPEDRITHINHELSVAYKKLITKIPLFEDMPDLAAGFQKRADNISTAIEVDTTVAIEPTE